jgi:hypothetical protein
MHEQSEIVSESENKWLYEINERSNNNWMNEWTIEWKGELI